MSEIVILGREIPDYIRDEYNLFLSLGWLSSELTLEEFAGEGFKEFRAELLWLNSLLRGVEGSKDVNPDLFRLGALFQFSNWVRVAIDNKILGESFYPAYLALSPKLASAINSILVSKGTGLTL